MPTTPPHPHPHLQDTLLTTSFDSLHSLDSPTASEYSTSILHHRHRHRGQPLPPIPDLRFEESYLNSIAAAHGVWWKVLLITMKDQLLLPLLQGLGYNLVLIGWKGWNLGARWGGRGVGSRLRRWWWGVNYWEE
ncbi:hypothetical protein HOY80DRAFT_1017825 [Tuber brumale]|nr:hypothetical protein HOY80DRAFT_1017825 [Tuber brumale]